LGLEKHVHFPGYIDGENYVGMLRAFDVGVFLVPGSDGTCRAVREIMSMGKPMVVADRGMLAEIVSHGRNGLVFDGNTEGLLESLDTLRAERRLRHEFGRNARADCIARHSIGAQSAAVRDVYEQVLRQVR
jgi:glycosyltransferase involved in cell wall biosynthesis